MVIIHTTRGALEENIMINNNSTAIVFDLRTRELEAFTASVTQLPSGKLVIRKATELGRLKDLPNMELGLPVILLGTYRAQTSEGFAGVCDPEEFSGRYTLAGGCGLGWGPADSETGKQKGEALRPMTDKEGTLFPLWYIPEATLQKMNVAGNSNTATADAALSGFSLLARMRKEVLITEGQSDWVNAWSLKSKKGSAARAEFPPEHRLDVFNEGEKIPKYAPHIRKPLVPTTGEGGETVVQPIDPNLDEFVEVDEPRA